MTPLLDARLDAMAAAIATARTLAAADGSLDLSGLDQAAREICDAVTALPGSERRLAAQRLAAIGAGLDALALALREAAERRAGATAGEGPGSRTARAGRAYRPPAPSDRPAPRHPSPDDRGADGK
jgi:hypothetical protein